MPKLPATLLISCDLVSCEPTLASVSDRIDLMVEQLVGLVPDVIRSADSIRSASTLVSQPVTRLSTRQRCPGVRPILDSSLRTRHRERLGSSARHSARPHSLQG